MSVACHLAVQYKLLTYLKWLIRPLFSGPLGHADLVAQSQASQIEGSAARIRK
jgi:hypothetical protein